RQDSDGQYAPSLLSVLYFCANCVWKSSLALLPYFFVSLCCFRVSTPSKAFLGISSSLHQHHHLSQVLLPAFLLLHLQFRQWRRICDSRCVRKSAVPAIST